MMNDQHSSPPKLDREIPTAVEIQPDLEAKGRCRHQKRFWVVVVVLAAVGTLAGVGTKALLNGEDKEEEPRASAELRNEIEALVADISNPLALLDPLSPQSQAVEWLAASDLTLTSADDPNLLPRYALMVFFFSTNGQFWRLTDPWDQASDLHQCNFSGVQCDDTDQVIGINLGGLGLSGTLPEELGLLKSLTRLGLVNNEIKGSIPESIFTETTNLVNLDLSRNLFSSTISSEIGNLKALKRLFLSVTHLSGTLPESLKQLSGLRIAHFFNADFEGPIFDFILSWPLLRTFAVHSIGDHGGSIPSEVGKFRKLTLFEVDGRSFTGTIPTEIANLPDLQLLKISGGSITGAIPSEIGNLSSLRALDLRSNTLSGTIPPELGHLSNLRECHTVVEVLAVLQNELEGRMPPEMCGLEAFRDCTVQCDCCVIPCGKALDD
eukprot:scaffold333_cov133-Cylindrotheca_fusiformis.AAC.27